MTLILQCVSEKGNYFNSLLSKIKKSNKKVCYISFNRSCDSLREVFKKKKINVNRLYSIDCITSTLQPTKKIKNCKYIEDPYNLKQISSAIKKAISKGHTFIIFDSLSNLLVYEQDFPAGGNILVNFIKSFSPALKKKKGNIIFICKKKDKEKFIIKETLSTFDKIVGNKK